MCIYSHDIIVLTGVQPTLRVYMFEKWQKNAFFDLDLHINGIFLFHFFLVFCTQAYTMFKYAKEKNTRHQSVWPPQQAPPDFFKKCTY